MSRPKEVTDAQIIKAARRVFLANGTQTPVATVASELGVSSTALHLRMGSKRDLVLKALCPTDPPVINELSAGPDGEEPAAERLKDILLQLQAWTDEEIPATFTLFSMGLRPEPGEEIDNSQPLRLRRALASWLRKTSRVTPLACSPRAAAEILLGSLEARALHAFISRQPLAARENRQFVRDLVATILPEETRD